MTERLAGLLLEGRIQVEIALKALEFTDINPDAAEHLRALIELHDQMSGPRSMRSFSVGEEAERSKADIITSLDALTVSNEPAEVKMAAFALLNILEES